MTQSCPRVSKNIFDSLMNKNINLLIRIKCPMKKIEEILENNNNTTRFTNVSVKTTISVKVSNSDIR